MRPLQEIAAITEYQWRSGIDRGLVKGSCQRLSRQGKTTLAKRLAYELGRRFEAEDEPPVALAFVDGGEILRSGMVRAKKEFVIFRHARSGFDCAGTSVSAAVR